MTIKVYTTKTCPWCVRVKEWLKERKARFEEVDVGMNQEAAKEMIKKSGQMGVPQVEINGKMIVGFDEAALEKELKKKKQ